MRKQSALAIPVYSFIFERLDFPRVPNQMNFISRGFTAPSRSVAVVQFETLLSLGATLGTWETRTRESAKKRNRPSNWCADHWTLLKISWTLHFKTARLSDTPMTAAVPKCFGVEVEGQ